MPKPSDRVLRAALRHAMRERTPDKPEVGAYHVDQPSMMRRIRALLDLAGAGGRVLFVGDDDLASVALHRLGLEDITVVDFDPEVRAAIERSTRGAVRTIAFDLRDAYDGNWPRVGRSYDLFVTDPPYTRDALRIFAAVGLGALRRGGSGYVVHPTERAARTSVGDPDRLAHALQTFVLASGSIITGVHDRSQRSYHGTVSSVLVVRRIRRSPIRLDDLDGPEDFYRTTRRKRAS